MYQTATTTESPCAASVIRSASRTAAILERALVPFKEGVEDLHWKAEYTPNCKNSMIAYVQKETTDIVVAIAAGKCHLTKKEAMDAAMKFFRLAALVLEDDPFLPMIEA